jgi:uncharacterized protein (UPF0276 family)
LSSPWVGIGYRRPFAAWLATSPPEVECIEITAEHFFDASDDAIRNATQHYPVFVHGLGLSLATPGPLDANTLSHFQRVVELSEPEWISEHVAFTRTTEFDLGHLNPIPPTQELLQRMIDKAMTLSERCGKPLILENITSELPMTGDMSETQFLNALCEDAGTGLLLDVTNLFINAHNHNFSAEGWFRELNPEFIVQLHIVGYAQRDGRYSDSHSESVQDELLELCAAVVKYAAVQAITLERDDNIPDAAELACELKKLKVCCHDN